jgi:hypothetical protein
MVYESLTTPQIEIKKKTHFVYTMISNIVCDLLFSHRNQLIGDLFELYNDARTYKP